MKSLQKLYLGDTPAGGSMSAAVKAKLAGQGCYDSDSRHLKSDSNQIQMLIQMLIPVQIDPPPGGDV